MDQVNLKSEKSISSLQKQLQAHTENKLALQSKLDSENEARALMAISLTQKNTEIDALLLIIEDLKRKKNQQEEEIIIEYYPERNQENPSS